MTLLKRTLFFICFCFKVYFYYLLCKSNLKRDPSTNVKVRKVPLIKNPSSSLSLISQFSVRQEWRSINVWQLRIWTKLLFVRVSVEIVTYEITQVHNNRRVKIGSRTIRLDCKYQKIRGWQTEQISEFSMEIFLEIGINIFHLYLFAEVCRLLLSWRPFFSFMWRSEVEMKYT